jgi:hypothetical protein
MEVVMKHKRIFNGGLIFLTVFLLWGWALSKDVVKSSWTAVPPAIDGVNADWTGAAFLTEKGVKVDYAFMNDGEFLYVLLTFKDPKYLSNIETTGINIYFNTEGKKKTDRGIRFYKRKVTGDEVIAIMEKRGEPLTEQDRASLQGSKIFYLYDWEPLGKDKEVPSQVPLPPGIPVHNPVFKAKMSENVWTYEFRIPLVKSENQPLGIGAGASQAIKIGFEWGGITEEMKKAAAKRGGKPPSVIDMSGSADGLRGGGGGGTTPVFQVPGGGARQGGGGSPKQYDFWLDVQLAVNK